LSQYLNQLPRQERPQLANLNLLLSRADKISAADIVKHDYFLARLSGDASHDNSWPLAQWRLENEELGVESVANHWLCADPVYIHPDRSEAILYAHEELQIQSEEAQALADLINHHYQDDPWQLHVGNSHRWYIQLEQTFDFMTWPLSSVKGKNVFEHLPVGDDSRYWQQCMNEIQMLLHDCEVNQQREQLGLMPVNSLWFWGYGRSTQTHTEQLKWDRVYSNDAVLNGLAKCSGCNVSGLPASINAIDTVSDKEVLVYVDKLKSLLQAQDIYGWLNTLQEFENNWISPLLDRFKKQPDLQVILLVDDNEAYQITKKNMKRWWRRSNKNNLF
jgi:hypothetical protein